VWPVGVVQDRVARLVALAAAGSRGGDDDDDDDENDEEGSEAPCLSSAATAAPGRPLPTLAGAGAGSGGELPWHHYVAHSQRPLAHTRAEKTKRPGNSPGSNSGIGPGSVAVGFGHRDGASAAAPASSRGSDGKAIWGETGSPAGPDADESGSEVWDVSEELGHATSYPAD
jgi:hypothetical protein